MSNDSYKLTAHEAIDKIKSKELTITEYISSCIDQITRYDDSIKAWSFFDGDKVLEQAEKLDKALDHQDGLFPFYGVPVGVKDIFNTEDMPTAKGSSLWEGYMPGNDARVVTKLKRSHALIMGKNSTAEFAVHAAGETCNPHNFDYQPGTSSSGSAAAVAAGMVPLSLTTQTAGSTIRPASFCGVFGYKPTFGLFPRTGILKTTDTLDHVSFMSRSLNDMISLYNHVRVKGPNYPVMEEGIKNSMRNHPQTMKRTWKIAIIDSPIVHDAFDYAKRSFNSFIENLKDKDLEIVHVSLPKELGDVHEIHAKIYEASLAYYFKFERSKSFENLSPVFKEMLTRGKNTSLKDYKNELEKQKILTLVLGDWFKDFDVALSLSSIGEAPKLEEPEHRGKKDTCPLWSFCGNPAFNVPIFKGPNNLPFGLQVCASKYSDELIFDFLKMLVSKNLISEKSEIAVLK